MSGYFVTADTHAPFLSIFRHEAYAVKRGRQVDAKIFLLRYDAGVSLEGHSAKPARRAPKRCRSKLFATDIYHAASKIRRGYRCFTSTI